MTKLLCALLVLLCAVPAQSALVVRISDLQYSLLPPNPIKVAGRVTSESPLILTDYKGSVRVIGIEARTGDFLIVEGTYDGNALTVLPGTGKASLLPLPGIAEMLYVPAGAFLMGNNGNEPYQYADESPLHEVNLPVYWIGRDEVTRADYRRFIEAGGYLNPAHWSADGWAWRTVTGRTEPLYWQPEQTWGAAQTFTQTDLHPVVGVSFYEAEAFCNWAGGRLPSEAEWEKAARAGGTQPYTYPWGNAWNVDACNHWYDSNAAGGGSGRYQTAPVGSYPASTSRYGCRDIAGNAWEWVSDWYISYPGSAGPFDYTGRFRVMRGGSWYDSGINYARCSVRSMGTPAESWFVHGLRLAR